MFADMHYLIIAPDSRSMARLRIGREDGRDEHQEQEPDLRTRRT